jgi:hypothetical protein
MEYDHISKAPRDAGCAIFCALCKRWDSITFGRKHSTQFLYETSCRKAQKELFLAR